MAVAANAPRFKLRCRTRCSPSELEVNNRCRSIVAATTAILRVMCCAAEVTRRVPRCSRKQAIKMWTRSGDMGRNPLQVAVMRSLPRSSAVTLVHATLEPSPERSAGLDSDDTARRAGSATREALFNADRRLRRRDAEPWCRRRANDERPATSMMQTIPRIGLAKLRSLRGRERLFHVAWGVARWLTVAIAVVAVCTFIDWRVDKYRETPMWLRDRAHGPRSRRAARHRLVLAGAAVDEGAVDHSARPAGRDRHPGVRAPARHVHSVVARADKVGMGRRS